MYPPTDPNVVPAVPPADGNNDSDVSAGWGEEYGGDNSEAYFDSQIEAERAAYENLRNGQPTVIDNGY